MSVYPPPIDQGTIFNPVDYGVETDTITIEYLNTHFIKYPTAQGLATFVGISNQSTTTCGGLVSANSGIDITSGNLQFPDNTTQATAMKTLTASQTYTNSTITTDAQGAISAVASGTPPANLTFYTGTIPSTQVATGLNGSAVVSVNSPTGQLVAGTWLVLAQVHLTSSNGYGAYNSTPSGQGCFRVLNPSVGLVYESGQAGTSFNNDVACSNPVNPATFTYQYNSNFALSCVFTLTATSGYLNFNFTGGVDQNSGQHNVLVDFTGEFCAIKLA
jgi:hypothetical protein